MVLLRPRYRLRRLRRRLASAAVYAALTRWRTRITRATTRASRAMCSTSSSACLKTSDTSSCESSNSAWIAARRCWSGAIISHGRSLLAWCVCRRAAVRGPGADVGNGLDRLSEPHQRNARRCKATRRSPHVRRHRRPALAADRADHVPLERCVRPQERLTPVPLTEMAGTDEDRPSDLPSVPSAYTPRDAKARPLPPTTVATRGAIDYHRLFDNGGFGNSRSVYRLDSRGVGSIRGDQQDADYSVGQSGYPSPTMNGHWFSPLNTKIFC